MHTAHVLDLSTTIFFFWRPCTRRAWWDNQSQVYVHFAAAPSNHKLNQKVPVIKNVGDFLKVMVDLELNRDIWHKKWMVPTHNPDLKSVSWLAKIPS